MHFNALAGRITEARHDSCRVPAARIVAMNGLESAMWRAHTKFTFGVPLVTVVVSEGVSQQFQNYFLYDF